MGIGISQHRFLLIGGSGFLGRQIARRLVKMGHRVAISTRRRDELKAPAGVMVMDQSEASDTLSSFDAVVILSVVNNDISASLEEVRLTNVECPRILAQQLANVPGSVFVAFGSVHAEDLRRTDPYSRSKRELRKALEQVEGVAGRLFIIPPAYGDEFVRKLRQIDRMPGSLRRAAICLIGAFKPLVHVDLIVAQLMREVAAESPPSGLIVRRIADDQSSNPVYRAVTRALDLILALGVLGGFFWLMILIALFIRVGSRGPALFLQPRVGQDGELFICRKFRTMLLGAPQVGTHEISPDMTTPIGRSLRKWKLDELPQIFNVLRNEMSWVGPRPNLPVQSELTEERRKRGVLKIKPGITGLAQVRDIDMSDPVHLAEVDAEFLFLRSIPLYFRLLLQTFLGQGRGDRLR